MWESACARVTNSAAGLVTPHIRKDESVVWRVAGSAFMVARQPQPTFLTCAHVLLDGHQRARGRFKAATGFGALGSHPVVPDLTILAVKSEIDATLFQVDADVRCTPVVFASVPQMATGMAVAALGCPLPSEYESVGGGVGSLAVELRLAVGWVSSIGSYVRFPATLYTSPDLLHHEINTLGYPGISGAPLFNLEGTVVGMMRGTKLDKGQVVAPYSYANRLAELLDFLNESGIPYAVA